MTPEEYNSYKFFLDIVIAISSLIIGIFSGVYLESKFYISNRFKKKNKQNTKQNGNDNQASISEAGDATNVKVNAKDNAKVDVTIEKKENAFKQQSISQADTFQLSQDAIIICNEFSERFKHFRLNSVDIFNDYKKAEKQKNINLKYSILIYIRIFRTITNFIEKYENNEPLVRELNKLIENLSNDDNKNFEKNIKNIEDLLIYDYLQRPSI